MVRVAFVMGEYPGEEGRRRADVARSYGGDGVEVGIVEIPASPYKALMTPLDGAMVGPLCIEGFIRAQEQGYDAAVPLGMLDLGVDGGKSAVDIPVVGALQSTLAVASMLGDRFGLITYRPESIPWARARVAGYGMADRIAGFRSSEMSMTAYADDREGLKQNFLAAARSLVEEDGAQVIIPAGVSQCPIHLDPLWVSEQVGVPVVEGIGTPIRVAATLARLGLTSSRIRYPLAVKPGEDLPLPGGAGA